MKMRSVQVAAAFGLVCSFTLQGCATTSDWIPMIDTKGVNTAAYESDLAECETLAKTNPDSDQEKVITEEAKKTGIKTAAIGGVAGVAATVATGGLALIPMVIMTAGAGATGAAAGAMAGGEKSEFARQQTVRSCLAGRGYSVVN